MNDPIIRKAFHCSYLSKEHAAANTLVVDELGLNHGKCRADIAVINGHINGYEIKSEKDSLARLRKQIELYNAVFDYSSIVLEERHLQEAIKIIPGWWGVIIVNVGKDDQILFETLKHPKQNNQIDDYIVAGLLWRNEVQQLLLNLGIRGAKLRDCRENLYQYITEMIDSRTLREMVRECLKKRLTWRDPLPPFLYDDSYQSLSK